MASPAIVLAAACSIGTAAYAAGTGGGTASSAPPSSSGRSATAPGQTGTAGTTNNSSAGRQTGSTGGPSEAATSGRSTATPHTSGSSAATGSAHSGAPAGAGSPAADNSANGNKGHIQVEGTFDCGGTTLCGEDNDPHLPCTLTVELFGYPSGDNLAAVTIAGQAPSGTGTVLTDSVPFAGSTSPNGSLLDTSRTYSMSVTQLTNAGLTAQPQQGYHLRVSVAVNGWPAKTHVVWLDCTPAVSGSSNGLTGGGGPLRPIGDTPALAPGSAADTPALASDSAPDSPLSASAAPDSSTTPASSGLAFTGFDAIAAIAVATAILLLGIALVVLSRRAKRVSV